MKKIMIMLGAVAMAAAVQASAVNWSTGKFQTAGDGGNGWSGSTLSAAISDTDGWLAEIYFFTDADCKNAVAGVNGTTDNTATKTGKAFTGATNDKFDSGSKYYTYLTITDADGNKLTSDVVSFTVGTLQAPELNFWSGDGFDEDAGAKGMYPTTGWVGGSDVPEPTSGLLLLIGMAGLALRRRRA